MYVIKAINQDGKEMYYDFDSRYGSGSYWTDSIYSAKMFKTIEDAQKHIIGPDFEKPQKLSDGTILPPRMINLATDFHGVNESKSCSLTIHICEVNLSVAASVTYNAELKIPKKVIYEY